MWYRISRRGDDFLLQNAYDGHNWLQMRITHMHAIGPVVRAGIYACSPQDGRFRCTFERLTIGPNTWQQE
jgi:regulation of enolase protein 1 (concanavalin A-like superfamily)